MQGLKQAVAVQGFELKRRGELKLIKVFQSEVSILALGTPRKYHTLCRSHELWHGVDLDSSMLVMFEVAVKKASFLSEYSLLGFGACLMKPSQPCMP